MSSSETESTDSESSAPNHTAHLGTSWEIAVVSVCVVVIITLLATTVFQLRRKARRKRQMQYDAERAQEAVGSEKPSETEGEAIKTPPPIHSSDSKRSSSISDHQKPTRYYWDRC
ncbi:hypothetical protein BDZ89DRAFT_1121157 [Hymenopellis radicata]|nr:hypothetical protein BDZ89DRAFT_1121157 [Hymenopellis radicata]